MSAQNTHMFNVEVMDGRTLSIGLQMESKGIEMALHDRDGKLQASWSLHAGVSLVLAEAIKTVVKNKRR